MPLQKRPFYGYDNSSDITHILNHNKLFQELLGITQEKLGMLFEEAVHLLQQGRFDEAKKGLEVLVKMNPYVPDFWIALGMCDQKFGKFEEALQSFLVAQTLDVERTETYLEAIDCCVELNRKTMAVKILNDAKKMMKTLPQEEKIIFEKELAEKAKILMV